MTSGVVQMIIEMIEGDQIAPTDLESIRTAITVKQGVTVAAPVNPVRIGRNFNRGDEVIVTGPITPKYLIGLTGKIAYYVGGKYERYQVVVTDPVWLKKADRFLRSSGPDKYLTIPGNSLTKK